MGRVYLGWDPQIGRLVAVKTVREDLKLSDRKKQEYLTRFHREARAAGRLAHPNIVAVYDVGDEAGVPWIAMEYVDGHSFKDLRRKGLPPLPSNVLWLGQRVAAALAAAHEFGVVHRDIKPANLLISQKGEVKVTDFGIARMADSELTREGVMLGSPSYMSPEQVRGRGVTGSSDYFGLAVILYEWITGQKPFEGKDLASITHKIVYESFDPIDKIKPEMAAAVNGFFEQALAKQAEDRFADSRSFVAALKSALHVVKETDTLVEKSMADVAAEPDRSSATREVVEETVHPGERSDSQTSIHASLPPRVGRVFVDISRGVSRGGPARTGPPPSVPYLLVAAGVGLLLVLALLFWLVQ